MRLVLCAVSTIALSGCSWLGGYTSEGYQSYNKGQAQSGAYAYNQGGYQNSASRCQIQSPQQPIPRGCDPASVTLATSAYGASNNYGATNGFPQRPQFGQPTQTSGSYGSHASVANQQGSNYRRQKSALRKPKFRGTLSLGGEKSFSGDAFDYADFPTIPATGLPSDPTINYIPNVYAEGSTSGSVASGQTVTTNYTAGPRDAASPLLYDRKTAKSKSFDDVWSTPARIAIGGEYILSPKNTVFVNAAYSAAEGKSGTAASVVATLFRTETTQAYDDMNMADGPASVNTFFIPDEEIATFSADFSDMKRYDLEVGARHYFNPISKSDGLNTVTPFVSASAGASHYNAVSYKTDQKQRFYEQAFNDPDGESTQFYNIDGQETKVELYDSQWVPSGQLNAGVEWQVTPRTGLAFETGVRVEGARKYSNDEKGDTNIAIPFTIRGSYNF
ncbi:hypothetical protein DES40_2589 [Litorimonas taeanensis]|uniref:Uncharacterized protein n=1 Tax=Litorimonas taeanensis TaxID=568099 RepID=A0A420WFL4_9PROT|nr:hypothetical protein [Litorimonas taeanensis]RKQ69780.1 hypothetical protein DES40_2589 [Litorimonas taeanensis]